MLTKEWIDRFMNLAALVGTWSKDPSTKVGAIIIDYDRVVLGLGYNGFPRGVADDDIRYENREIKYPLIVHAEMNAILNSYKRGCALITTKYPCSTCTKAIVQYGLSMVYTPPPEPARFAGDPWEVDAQYATMMMFESGISVVHVD